MNDTTNPLDPTTEALKAYITYAVSLAFSGLCPTQAQKAEEQALFDRWEALNTAAKGPQA